MPVPKRKRSRARIRKRFANKNIETKAFAACSQCKTVVASHQACHSCGYYKGNKVLATKEDRLVRRTEVREKRAKHKPQQEQEG